MCVGEVVTVELADTVDVCAEGVLEDVTKLPQDLGRGATFYLYPSLKIYLPYIPLLSIGS